MLWVVVEQKKAITGWSFFEVVLIEKLKAQASKNLPAGLTRTVFGNRCLRFDKEVVNRFPLLNDLTYPQTQRYTVDCSPRQVLHAGRYLHLTDKT